jgi:hypothetical protein
MGMLEEVAGLSLRKMDVTELVERVYRVVGCYLYECRHYVRFYNPSIGGAMYYYASLINHSCDPNCVIMPTPKQATVISLRPIKAGEEVTVSYFPAHTLPQMINISKMYAAGQFNSGCLCRSANCLYDGSKTALAEIQKLTTLKNTTADEDLAAACAWLLKSEKETQPTATTAAATTTSVSAGMDAKTNAIGAEAHLQVLAYAWPELMSSSSGLAPPIRSALRSKLEERLKEELTKAKGDSLCRLSLFALSDVPQLHSAVQPFFSSILHQI